MDKKLLLDTGKKKGLSNKGHIEKDYYQDFLLFSLFKRTNNLIFKGGTALYKIYKLPRFSEGMDFALAGAFNVSRLINDVAGLVKADVETRIMKDSMLFKIKFNGMLTGYNTLRVDISTKNKALEGFDIVNYVPEYVDINPFSLRVMKPEEMIAEKIHSLLSRKKARDLYDLFFLLRISKFNKRLVDKKLEIFGMRFSQTKFNAAINGTESIWKHELKPFVLEELTDFKTVKKFVAEQVKC